MTTKFWSFLLTITVLLCVPFVTLESQTILLPGDIIVTNLNETPSHLEFAFITFVQIQPGTEIYFTDRGIKSDGTLLPPSPTEGIVKITIPVTDTINAGSIILFSPRFITCPLVQPNSFVSAWSSVIDSGTFSIQPGGDQIIAFQGTPSSPTFITALNHFGTSWQSEAIFENESCLPIGLTDMLNAFSIPYISSDSTSVALDFNAALGYAKHSKVMKDGYIDTWPYFWDWDWTGLDYPYDFGYLDDYSYDHGYFWLYAEPMSPCYWELWEWYWWDFDFDPIPNPFILGCPPLYPLPINPSDPFYLQIHPFSLTCPVELSSFTAIPTADEYIRLEWVTQSETEVSGYYLLRNSDEELSNAIQVNALIPACNTSQETNYSYIDDEVEPGTWYYWLENLDLNGSTDFHGPISVTLTDGDNPDNPLIPDFPSLKSIYPNPFMSSATVSFELTKAGKVQLEVFNLKGEKVRTLVSGEKASGMYLIPWDGKDNFNRNCSAGIYFVKMTSGEFMATRKLVKVE